MSSPVRKKSRGDNPVEQSGLEDSINDMTSPLVAARTPIREETEPANSPSPIRRSLVDEHRGVSARVDSFPLLKLDASNCSTIHVLADSAQSGFHGTIIAASKVILPGGEARSLELFRNKVQMQLLLNATITAGMHCIRTFVIRCEYTPATTIMVLYCRSLFFRPPLTTYLVLQAIKGCNLWSLSKQ